MWKYVSRRIRDTLERNAAHFDRRSTTGFANSPNSSSEDKEKKSPSCSWYSRCCNSYQNENNTNSNKWNFEHLNRTWIGAITWSSALVIGWYASQVLHLRHKYHLKEPSKTCPTVNGIFSALYPYVKYVKKNEGLLKPIPNVENVIKTFTPTVHLIGNDHDGENNHSDSGVSRSTTPDCSSENDLGEVLNSIENKLGLAAIENGQHQDGLNLLRSAANRNHAPAQYNLGLCYEMGLGVAADEKMAMELYRSAAAREHPAALYNLGIYYGQGRGGLKQDVATATRLLRLAAVQAMELYRSAAAREHPAALYNLGIYYGQGRGGLKQDVATATRLLRLAAVQGQQDAINALKKIEEDPVEAKSTEDSWTYAYPSAPYLGNDSIVPAQSTLFIENAQMFHTQIY